MVSIANIFQIKPSFGIYLILLQKTGRAAL